MTIKQDLIQTLRASFYHQYKQFKFTGVMAYFNKNARYRFLRDKILSTSSSQLILQEFYTSTRTLGAVSDINIKQIKTELVFLPCPQKDTSQRLIGGTEFTAGCPDLQSKDSRFYKSLSTQKRALNLELASCVEILLSLPYGL